MDFRSRIRAHAHLVAFLIPCFFSMAAVGGTGPVSPASKGKAYGTAGVRPFTMAQADVEVEWAVDRDHEVGCGGSAVAGGSTVGDTIFSHLGKSRVAASAAWDIGHLVASPTYTPTGPAGGPVAPVLGPTDYPYEFHFDPRAGACASGLVATGAVLITAASGDEVHGTVQGGETHRLDFVVPGDGVESFIEVAISGGTGRFENATGSFTMHTILRFDSALGYFVIDLAELLPGATLGY